MNIYDLDNKQASITKQYKHSWIEFNHNFFIKYTVAIFS